MAKISNTTRYFSPQKALPVTMIPGHFLCSFFTPIPHSSFCALLPRHALRLWLCVDLFAWVRGNKGDTLLNVLYLLISISFH